MRTSPLSKLAINGPPIIHPKGGCASCGSFCLVRPPLTAAPPEPAEATSGFSSNRKTIDIPPVRRYCSGQKKRWFKIPIQSGEYCPGGERDGRQQECPSGAWSRAANPRRSRVPRADTEGSARVPYSERTEWTRLGSRPLSSLERQELCPYRKSRLKREEVLMTTDAEELRAKVVAMKFWF